MSTCCSFLFCTFMVAAGGSPAKPNVLILLTDDLRTDAVRALGGGAVQTPHLDRLASQSVLFRNCYILGSNSPAVCLPSRNMLLSGRAYFRWQGAYASADDPNLPTAFRNAGYETYHHGKRGNVAVKIQERFETNLYLDDEKDRTSGEPGKEIVDRAIGFLSDRDPSKPFVMYLAFANPHDPRVAAKRYLDRYDRSSIPLPRNFLPRHPFDNGELNVRDEKLAGMPREAEEVRRHLHEYYAVMTGLDENIGRLLAKLDHLHLTDRTIVVFSSDNGLALGSHGLMGKQNLYDHSAKVPLTIKLPGVEPFESDALVYLHDLFPTLADLAGIPIPTGLDSASLKPILTREKQSVRDAVLLTYRDVQRGIRDERYKLIVYPKIDRVQLFDLNDDPDEMKDLSGNPEQANRMDRMKSRLREEQKRFGDPLAIR